MRYIIHYISIINYFVYIYSKMMFSMQYDDVRMAVNFTYSLLVPD